MPKEIHSIAQEAAAVRTAMSVHDWPVEVEGKNDVTVSLFRKAQAQRHHDDWTANDLQELARICTLVELGIQIKRDLDEEGLRDAKGKPNVLFKMLLDVQSSINTSYRRIGMTSMSVPAKQARASRGKQAREVHKLISSQQQKAQVGDGDLLN